VSPLALADYADALPQDAALWRSINPDHLWDLHAMLLAALVDEVRALRWEESRLAGVKGIRPPDPIVRPGVEPPKDVTTFGGPTSALPLDEMAIWLGQDMTATT